MNKRSTGKLIAEVERGTHKEKKRASVCFMSSGNELEQGTELRRGWES
jgi:hypothetical protein